jgi:ABC-type amino acid transport substrate-binding protein
LARGGRRAPTSRSSRSAGELARKVRALFNQCRIGGIGYTQTIPFEGRQRSGPAGPPVDGHGTRRHAGRAKRRGTLVVEMEAAYVPYEFVKDGMIMGYDPDIIAIMVKNLGVNAQLIDTAWMTRAGHRGKPAPVLPQY